MFRGAHRRGPLDNSGDAHEFDALRSSARIFVGMMILTTEEVTAQQDGPDDFEELSVIHPIGTPGEVQEIEENGEKIQYFLMFERSHAWVTRSQFDLAPDSIQMKNSSSVMNSDGSLRDSDEVKSLIANMFRVWPSVISRVIVAFLEIFIREYPENDHQRRRIWYGIEPFRHGRNGVGVLKYYTRPEDDTTPLEHYGYWFGTFVRNKVDGPIFWMRRHAQGYWVASPRKAEDDVISFSDSPLKIEKFAEWKQWFQDWSAAMDPLSQQILPDIFLINFDGENQRHHMLIRPRQLVDGYDYPDAGILKILERRQNRAESSSELEGCPPLDNRSSSEE